MKTLLTIAGLVSSITLLSSCGSSSSTSEESAVKDVNLGLEMKLATLEVGRWYPDCALGGCWKDHTRAEGIWGTSIMAEYATGDYAIKTRGTLHVECREGEKIKLNIPEKMEVGEKTQWFKNPCRGGIKKLTMQAGLNGTWGEGQLVYWTRVAVE